MKLRMAPVPAVLLLLAVLIGLAVGVTAWHAYDSSPITRAKRQLCRLAEAYRDHPHVTNRFPDLADFAKFANARDPQVSASTVDPWRTPLGYFDKGGIITSAGPDKSFGSCDDLSITAYNHRWEKGRIPLSAVEYPVRIESPRNWRVAALGQCAALMILAVAYCVFSWKRQGVVRHLSFNRPFILYSAAVAGVALFSWLANLAAIYERIVPGVWTALMPLAGPPIAVPLLAVDVSADLLPARSGCFISTAIVLLACAVTYYAVMLFPVTFGGTGQPWSRWNRRTVTLVVLLGTHGLLLLIAFGEAPLAMPYMR
jgi:hypothetical protein